MMNSRVLIVDDSRILRRAIRKTVLMAGVSEDAIYEAGNGQEALDVLADNPVDLVLLDLNMPVMDGEAFAKFIHGKPEYQHLQIVVVSTESNEARLDRVREHGVTDTLHKPFEPEDLCRLVAKRAGATS